MTTCTNKNRGCRIMRHPDDENCWFCPHCGKKFIEYSGFPVALIIVVGIMLFTGLALILSSCQSADNLNVVSKSINFQREIKYSEGKNFLKK